MKKSKLLNVLGWVCLFIAIGITITAMVSPDLVALKDEANWFIMMSMIFSVHSSVERGLERG